MAYNITMWKDHAVTPARTFKVVENADGTVTLTPAGEILQQGTNQSAANFNNMEQGIFAAAMTANEAVRLAQILQHKTDGLAGLELTIKLTSSKNYPFNDSKVTIPLPVVRNTKDYTVHVEVLGYAGGGVGEFEITDKLLNGFKIAYSGGASFVDVKCVVQGGI